MAVAFGFSHFLKQSAENKKNDENKNSKCDSIKSLLDQKIKEMEDAAKNWSKDQIEKILKEAATNKFLSEQEKKIVKQMEAAKEKYDQLKKAIDILQEKFDLCVLDLKIAGEKKVYIIHGWGGSPDSDWYSWLARELKNKGFRVIVPEMPETDNPQIKKWVSHLSKIVPSADENTFFVGHSIGCQAILRYLEKSENKSVGGAVFVAGWFNLMNLDKEEAVIAEPWLKTPINFSKIRKALQGKLVVILSDNDPYNCLEENKRIFENQLKAEVIVEKNKGHLAGEDGCNQLPEALEAILKLSGL